MKQSNASLDAPFLMAGIAAVAAGVLFSPLVLTLSPVALLVAPVNLLFWKFYSAKLHHFLPIFRLGQLYLIATITAFVSSLLLVVSLPLVLPLLLIATPFLILFFCGFVTFAPIVCFTSFAFVASKLWNILSRPKNPVSDSTPHSSLSPNSVAPSAFSSSSS